MGLISIPRLIIVFGPPCSGKTTISRRIASFYGIKYVSTDLVRKQLYGEIPIFTEKSNNHVFSKFLDDVNLNLKNGRSVICEALLISKERRKKLLRICPNKTGLLFITASLNILLRRLSYRVNNSKNGGNIFKTNIKEKELGNISLK